MLQIAADRSHLPALAPHVQEEFYSVAFRKKLYTSLEELQVDLDNWVREYDEQREHSGKCCFKKTPMQRFLGFDTDGRGEDAGSSDHWGCV